MSTTVQSAEEQEPEPEPSNFEQQPETSNAGQQSETNDISEPSQPSTSTSKTRSIVWVHFTVEEDTRIHCNYCSCVYHHFSTYCNAFATISSI
jgi:hypothetical protein